MGMPHGLDGAQFSGLNAFDYGATFEEYISFCFVYNTNVEFKNCIRNKNLLQYVPQSMIRSVKAIFFKLPETFVPVRRSDEDRIKRVIC